jgi:hypothetical protein
MRPFTILRSVWRERPLATPGHQTRVQPQPGSGIAIALCVLIGQPVIRRIKAFELGRVRVNRELAPKHTRSTGHVVITTPRALLADATRTTIRNLLGVV